MSMLFWVMVLVAITVLLMNKPKTLNQGRPGQKGRPGATTGNHPFSSFGRQAPPIDKGSMIRCHQCGCFFPESRAVTAHAQGHELHFCSENCKRLF
jgi:Pyruvate/2-oxoacid:ferredoxin oxidoreductase delta subunit